VNKVWVVNRASAGGAPVAPGDIRTYANFTEIKHDYQIEGMICTLVLPLMRNEAAAREALLREAAAEMGANGVVGLESVHHPYAKAPRSRGILVDTRVASNAKQGARPRFIVCALPVAVTSDKTNLASRLATPVALELQYHLAQKGYYTYAGTSASFDVRGLVAETELPAGLSEPLGVLPDFILSCQIEDGTRLGLQSVEMRVALYDLQQLRNVFEHQLPVVEWGLLEQLTSPGKKWFNPTESEIEERVHTAVEAALMKVSPVSGYGERKK